MNTDSIPAPSKSQQALDRALNDLQNVGNTKLASWGAVHGSSRLIASLEDECIAKMLDAETSYRRGDAIDAENRLRLWVENGGEKLLAKLGGLRAAHEALMADPETAAALAEIEPLVERVDELTAAVTAEHEALAKAEAELLPPATPLWNGPDALLIVPPKLPVRARRSAS